MNLALTFYLGGIVASLPLGLGMRATNPRAVWPLLIHTLGWPLFIVMWLGGAVRLNGSASTDL